MTTGQDQFGAETQGAGQRTAGGSPRVPAPPPLPARYGENEAATITAELPAAPVRRRSSGAPPPAPPSLPRRRRREPAPVLLRLAVWLLALTLGVALVGAIIEQKRPQWLSFLRNRSPATAGTSGAPGRSASPANPANPASPASPTARITLISSTATGADYSVPVSSYQVVITVGPGACYVEIKAPPAAATFSYAQTIPGGSKPTSIPQHGASAVTVEASASSLAITSGGRSLGEISPPRLNYTYTFTPETN